MKYIFLYVRYIKLVIIVRCKTMVKNRRWKLTETTSVLCRKKHETKAHVWCTETRQWKKKTQLFGKYIIMQCILSLFLSLSLLYIYKTAAHCAYTSFKNNSFRGRLRGGRREKESSLPSPPPLLHSPRRAGGVPRGEAMEMVVRRGWQSVREPSTKCLRLSGVDDDKWTRIERVRPRRGAVLAKYETRIYFHGVYFFLALNSLYIESDYVRELRSLARRLCRPPPARAIKCH